MAALEALINAAYSPSALAEMRARPVPPCDAPEPDAATQRRICRQVMRGNFADLSVEDKIWVCKRLFPSLVRHGRYPPPVQATYRRMPA